MSILYVCGWAETEFTIDMRFQYELVRSSSMLRNQASLLESLALPNSSSQNSGGLNALTSILEIIGFYEQKVGEASTRTAIDGVRVIELDVEVNGFRGATTFLDIDIP
jgi:hypothetical protein